MMTRFTGYSGAKHPAIFQLSLPSGGATKVAPPEGFSFLRRPRRILFSAGLADFVFLNSYS
jgi:hypothetical protein